MGVEKLDHYSVRTTDLARSQAFYERALGFIAGPRPPLNFPGAWLYPTDGSGAVAGASVVHLIGLDGPNSSALADYLGADSKRTGKDTGALDHIAFSAKNIEEAVERLVRNSIPFRERQVPDMDLRQLFVEDPEGVTVELNFFGAASESASVGA